jgi:hypothetical protein
LQAIYFKLITQGGGRVEYRREAVESGVHEIWNVFIDRAVDCKYDHRIVWKEYSGPRESVRGPAS